MTPLDHLWTGWRHEYVTSVPDADDVDTGGSACVFCRILASGLTDDETFVVHRGSTAFAILNAYPYSTGHLLVLPFRHVRGLDELTDEESEEVWGITRRATEVVGSVYDPEGVNIGFNIGRAAGAGIPGHVHGHVVPRWSGDTNFMTSVANTRVLPEALDVTWSKMRQAW
ncbi:MAG TPA: HIT domain-containing protein [Acidimicrobiales bacterium]